MAPLIVIAHLKPSDATAKRKVLDAFEKIAAYSLASEPGVTKFCIAVPRSEEEDPTSIFAVEEYADQAALNAHIAAPPVQDLIKLFETEPSLFSSPSVIHGLPSPLHPSATSFIKPEIAANSDPYIVLSHREYKNGSISGVVKGSSGDRQGVLMSTIVADEGKENESSWVRTVEAYESEEAAEGMNEKGSGGGKEELHKLRMVVGYLWKEGEKSKL